MIALYLLCAVAGVSFMGISALLGHFGTDHGGHAGHGHAGHHGAHAGDHGGLDLPFFSPTAIAAYVTGFGGGGLLLTQALHLTSPLVHVPLAATFAALFGVGVLFGMAKLAEHTEGNSLASLDEIVGQEAEVTIAIPAGGMGEVAYVAAGTRQQAMARAEAGQSFPQGSRVRVTRALDGTLYVSAAAQLASAASVGEPVAARPGQREKLR